MKKRSLIPVALSSVAVIALASGCKLTRNLDEMHDATVGMSQKMDGTNDKINATHQTTEEMLGLTTNLYHTTSSTYTDLRQGNSLTIRANALKNMDESESMEAKISEAGIYFMAYEFQLWKNQGHDNEPVREGLFADAMNQFFRDMRRYTDPEMKVDPTSGKNDMRNLYALSVAMHRVNPNQLTLAQATGVEEASVLSLIKATLLKKADIESGKLAWDSVPEFEREILTHEKEALYLLKLRANFLPMMLLSKLTRIAEVGLFGKAKLLLFEYDASLKNLSYAELQEYRRWAREASDTLEFLKELTGKVEINKKVKKLYRNMRLESTRAVDAHRHGAEGGLADEITRFRGIIDAEPAKKNADDAGANAS